MRTFLMLAFVTVILSGCEFSDAKRCENYGFRPGTDAYAGCMQNEAARTQDMVNSIMDRNQRSLDSTMQGIYGNGTHP